MSDPYVTMEAGANYFETPDAAQLDIAGPLDIRCDVALDSYNVGTINNIVYKYQASPGQRAFTMYINSRINYVVSIDGGGTGITVTSDLHGILDGNRAQFRVTHDTATGIIDFYVNGSVFDSGAVTAGAINTNTQPLLLGVTALRNDCTARKMYSVQLYDGIDGTLAADWQASDIAGAL